MKTLPEGSRRFLTGYAAASAALALLDIVALGLVAALLPGLVSGQPMVWPVLGDITEKGLVLPLLIFICLLIVLKGILAVMLLRFATKRFARHEVAIGDRLFAAYLASPWEKRLGRNSAEIVRSVDVGVGITVSGVLMPAMTLFGELGTMVAVVVVLFIAQPLIAIVTMLYLGLVALLLAKVISPRAVAIGRQNREWSNRTAKTLYEALGALKEITLADRGPEVQVPTELAACPADAYAATLPCTSEKWVRSVGVRPAPEMPDFASMITPGSRSPARTSGRNERIAAVG